jgi:ATP-binding cassette, subfamily B, multidrug efflux pump
MLVFFLGGRQVVGGTLSLGDLVAFNAYLVQLAMPTLMFGWILTLVQRAAASMDRLQPLLELAEPPPGKRPAGPSPPSLELHGLDFRHGRTQVLAGLDLTIAAGETLGLAGATASGKSTLLKLLAGLYPSAPGMLFRNAVDLAQIDLHAHRRTLAMVPQEGRLFSGSLAENLLYGCPEAPLDRLVDVAQTVQLRDEALAMPDQWQTRVGEGGLSLSGGQRQRVALGRALARGGDLWLLDDPFSHLDTATAREVRDALRPLWRGKTVIVASSRVGLLMDLDRVAVLADGRLVEIGPPQQLAAGNGPFARLLERERLREELEALA